MTYPEKLVALAAIVFPDFSFALTTPFRRGGFQDAKLLLI
jgi:hypothetical protein